MPETDIASVLENSLTEEGLRRIVTTHSSMELYWHPVRPPRKAVPKARKVAKKAVKGGPRGHQHEKPQPNFMTRLKREFDKFLCSHDQTYADLRRQLSLVQGRRQTYIVTTIAAAVGAKAGVVGGAAVAYVATWLLAMLQIGKEAYCAGVSEVKIK
jgi:hypothetical protein